MTFQALVLGLVCGASAASGPNADERPPNVLFIAIDDLNDWIGCMDGHPDAKTPNIDRLAARGTLFTRAYCAAPACNPSRVAVMTGLHPTTSGIYRNRQFFRDAMPDAITLPQHFTSNGYRAVGGGKIYHGHWPDPASWQDYFPSKDRTRPQDVVRQRPFHGIDELTELDWGPLDVVDEEMSDHQIVDWAIGELSKSHEEPFFLAVGIYRPHLPWFVPRRFVDAFPADEVALPDVISHELDDIPAVAHPQKYRKLKHEHAIVRKHRVWRDAVAGYLASIAFADEQVGRLIDALDASPHKDETVVVLWSDHGFHLGEKDRWRKFTLWEEAARAPLLFAGPGVSADAVCERTVSLMDIYPTLNELCGLPPREQLDGVSLLPLLKEADAPWDQPSVTSLGVDNHSVRTERWRYTRYHDGSEELYDHATDPLEHVNLAEQEDMTAVMAELAQLLPDPSPLSAPSQPKEPR